MIVLSTCWYKLNCKFNQETYQKWMDNLLSNVNNFYLVIYTNRESYSIIEKYENNPKIKIVLLEIEDFYNYQYKDFWIKNHEKNHLLKTKICWEVNMLWAEKISFVKRTMEQNYFNSDWYGWCDIGYFRCGGNDLNKNQIKHWPDNKKIQDFNKDKVVYGIVRNDNNIITNLNNMVNNKNEKNLPVEPILNDLWCIGGGFFILHSNKICWWHETFDSKLKLYFNNNYLVKDDQIVIVDCIFSDIDKFNLIVDKTTTVSWFVFQKYLL